MNDAIELFYYIFTKIYNFVFNQAVFTQGVSIGWVLVAVILFGIVVSSVLNIPSGLKIGKYETRSYYYDDKGYQRTEHHVKRGLHRNG